jgi:hypothetical protein
MTRGSLRLAMVALALTAATSCKDEPNPCDSTTYLSGSDCLPKTDAAVPTVDLPPAPAVDTSEGEASGTSLLGAACTDNVTNAECQGPGTDYCAIQPGAAGYCTKSGCVTDADCPTSWTCFDLSKMGITGYPTMCVKPRG